MDDVIALDKKTDLVYSSDDDGWYLQRYLDNLGNTKTSPIYNTKEFAIKAWRCGCVTWS